MLMGTESSHKKEPSQISKSSKKPSELSKVQPEKARNRFDAEEWSKFIKNKWGSMIPQFVGDRSDCRVIIQGPSPDQLISDSH